MALRVRHGCSRGCSTSLLLRVSVAIALSCYADGGNLGDACDAHRECAALDLFCSPERMCANCKDCAEKPKRGGKCPLKCGSTPNAAHAAVQGEGRLYETDRLAQWPTVMVIGQQKAGTSAFHMALERLNPETCGRRKEMHFWDQPAPITTDQLAAYIERYPRACLAGNGSGRAAGTTSCKCHFNMDNTPRYSRDEAVPARIFDLYPKSLRNSMRFVLIVREPATRLLSVYHHFAAQFWYDPKTGESSCGGGFQKIKRKKQKPKAALPLSFGHYVDLTITPHAEDASTTLRSNCYGADGIMTTPATIQRFQREFGPGSLLTLTYETLSEKPVQAKRAVAEFLGMNTSSPALQEWLAHHNAVRVNTRAHHPHQTVVGGRTPSDSAAFADCVNQINKLTEAFQGSTERLHSLVTGPNAPAMQPPIPPNFGFGNPIPAICGIDPTKTAAAAA